MSFEFPLVFFTILSQFALGLAIFLCWANLATPGHLEAQTLRKGWLWVFIISALALFASLFHLGHPFAAWKALINLGGSWLSREVLFFSIFCGLAFVNIYAKSSALGWLAALSGVIGVFAQGITYGPPAMPALNNFFPLALFGLSALALGSCCVVFFGKKADVARPFVLALFVLIMAAPILWQAGSATMQATSAMWLGSPLFWLGIALIALAFALSFFQQKSGIARLASLLCGLFLTRLAFFADTMHTAANLGLPYN